MRVPALAVVILASFARWTTAEINTANTIEWITADSDVVVVGTITQVTTRQGPGSVVWYDVTLGVTETIKGASRQTAKLAIRHLHGVTPADWKQRDAELLVFLVDSKRRVADDKDYARAPFALHTSHGDPSVYELARPQAAYTMAFEVVNARKPLLEAVRGAAKSKATKAHRVDAPWGSDAQKSLYSGSTVWLYLPIDASLERLAILWLASPSVTLRQDAVGALVHFKSADTIKRLEKLLADPGVIGTSDANNKPIKRYVVRKQAHAVLTTWGVKHATPVIEEP